jgi:peptide/nickel transport system permease protein
MNPVSMIAQQPHSAGLWLLAWRRLKADTTAMISLAVVAVFLLIISLSAAGFIAADWDAEIAVSYAPPGWSQQAAKAAGLQQMKVQRCPIIPMIRCAKISCRFSSS